MKAQKTNEYLEDLRKWLKPGTKVYSILRWVNRAGDNRAISFKIVLDGDIISLDWYISRALDYKINRNHSGINVSGGGMDMGYHVVNTLSYALHGYDHDKAGYTLDHTWL